MNFGFASSVKGIRTDARRTAEEAARRAGLPLNDWLNAVILQQGAKQGIRPSPQARFEEERPSEGLSDVQTRLEDFGRRLDQITRSGFAAYAPRRSREEAAPLVEQFARLEQRIEQLASNITQPPAAETPSKQALFAIAEITARRRMPAAVPTGSYGIEVELFTGGNLAARTNSALDVIKTGFEQYVADAARDYGLLYGAVTAMMALLIGWFASVIFARD